MKGKTKRDTSTCYLSQLSTKIARKQLYNSWAALFLGFWTSRTTDYDDLPLPDYAQNLLANFVASMGIVTLVCTDCDRQFSNFNRGLFWSTVGRLTDWLDKTWYLMYYRQSTGSLWPWRWTSTASREGSSSSPLTIPFREWALLHRDHVTVTKRDEVSKMNLQAGAEMVLCHTELPRHDRGPHCSLTKWRKTRRRRLQLRLRVFSPHPSKSSPIKWTVDTPVQHWARLRIEDANARKIEVWYCQSFADTSSGRPTLVSVVFRPTSSAEFWQTFCRQYWQTIFSAFSAIIAIFGRF